MEQWLPLFRHLLASPAPNAAAFSSSPDQCPSSPPPAAALLRLLLSPAPTLPSASDAPAVVLFQTLPPLLQSQALSFLSSVPNLLDPLQLRSLAARVLSAPSGRYDFWVRRGARHLLDGLPEEGVLGVSEEFIEDLDALPPWLLRHVLSCRGYLLMSGAWWRAGSVVGMVWTELGWSLWCWGKTRIQRCRSLSVFLSGIRLCIGRWLCRRRSRRWSRFREPTGW